MTKMLQRNRRFGKLRDPEELVVRGQLRYLADVLAELRRQPGRGFIGATGLPEHVAKNNTRFSTHGLLDFGGPVSARGPAGVPGLVLHQRMVRPKDLGICSEGRHRASPAFPREVTGAAGLQPAPAAMSSLSRTWRTSRRCSPALLGGLAGDAEPGADLSPGVRRQAPRPGSRALMISGSKALTCGYMARSEGLEPRRFLCGHPASFRAVRDLGLVPAGCPRGSGASQGCSSVWLPAWLPATRASMVD